MSPVSDGPISILFMVVFIGLGFSNGQCPEGFQLIGDNCYYFSKTATNQVNAEGACKTAGGHLFEPRSLEELQDVSKLSPIIEEEENWWIGVLREHPDAELVYITDNQDIFDQLEKEGNEVNTNQEHRYICQAQAAMATSTTGKK